ncbi:TetR/AcrR family transcriptional regulator [Polyangium spumosum]|uniref:TetR family transcriptional regulator n=1 Tax=Polyangium spumosum TaxID=889282 RepID=A0A6N7PQH5_9BACT|nr:TetR/AcrR family transcriptional regulator [Polyangium spumosum]MRG94318.1 TetR family transcriptional regulator [Polyangium spumosum]
MTRTRLPGADRRRQIAEAALRIIATAGVHRLTAVEIAREVGIADGSIFRHFEDKRAIVAAAVDVFEGMLLEDFPPEDPDPLERLKSFLLRRLALVRAHPEILRLAFNDRLVEAAGEEGAARVQASVQRSMSFVRACLAEAQEKGTITSAVPVDVMVWAVTGILRGAAFQEMAGASKSPPLTPEALWPSIAALLRGPPLHPTTHEHKERAK